MLDFRHFLPVGLVALTLLPLAGCDTLGMNFGSPSPPPVAQRSIDYTNDDLSTLVFAVDAPTGLRPVPNKSIATFDATTDKTGKHVKATLVLVDGDAVESALPPPAPGRTYYLLGFSAKDKTALLAAQKWLKGLPPDSAPVTALQVAPSFCSEGLVDPTTATISVLPAIAGGAQLVPMISSEPLSNLLADTAGKLPTCPGTKAG